MTKAFLGLTASKRMLPHVVFSSCFHSLWSFNCWAFKMLSLW